MSKKHYPISIFKSFILLIAFILFIMGAVIVYAGMEARGLSCQEVYYTINNQTITRPEVKMGEALKIHFDGVEGFNVVGNRVYPSMQVLVVGQDGQQVLFAENAFEDLTTQGIPAVFSKKLSATVGVDEPMQDGRVYAVDIRISDTKSNASMHYKTSFMVKGVLRKEHVSAQDIVSSGLVVEKMVFAKDNIPSTYNVFSVGDKVQAVLVNVGVFQQGDDGLHNFDIDAMLTDSSGNIVMQQNNLLGENGHVYLSNNTAQSPYIFFDTKNYIPGKYTVSLSIYDNITGNRATATKSFGLLDLKQKP